MIASHDLPFAQKMTSLSLQSLRFNSKFLLNSDGFMDSAERTCTYSTHCAFSVHSETVKTNSQFRNDPQ